MLVTSIVLLLRLLGGLFVALGAIGLFLPIWPTTIFWILAAICFARSSPEARDWIYARPGIGPQIEAFVERGTISRAGKLAALTGMTIAGLICAFVLRQTPYWLAATITVLVLVAAFILTRKTD